MTLHGLHFDATANALQQLDLPPAALLYSVSLLTCATLTRAWLLQQRMTMERMHGMQSVYWQN